MKPPIRTSAQLIPRGLVCSIGLLVAHWSLPGSAAWADQLKTKSLEPTQIKIPIGPGEEAFQNIERLGFLRDNEIVAVKHTDHGKIVKEGVVVNTSKFVSYKLVAQGQNVVNLTESGEIREVTSRWPLRIGTAVIRESNGTAIWVYIPEIGYFEYFEFTKDGVVNILDGDSRQRLKDSHARIWTKDNPGK